MKLNKYNSTVVNCPKSCISSTLIWELIVSTQSMPSVNIYVLDSRLAANSLQSVPYSKRNFDEQPRTHVEATGVFLHLFGRSDKGQSVVVETECKTGMSVQFLDGTDDPQCDDTFAEKVKREVLGLLDLEQAFNGPESGSEW